jgi:hypothetical protein
MAFMATTAAANGRLFRQASDLRSKYPTSRPTWGRGQPLRWVGDVRPTRLSDTYTVEICWDGRRSRPTVRVLKPTLKVLPGQQLPHTFGDGSLCLHFDGEWSSEMLISDTIIPWASEWLYYYELWLATGEWTGGGHMPMAKARADDTPPAPQLPRWGRRRPGKAGPSSRRPRGGG